MPTRAICIRSSESDPTTRSFPVIYSASRVAESLSLDEDPSDIAQRVTATIVPDTVLIDITATGATPEEALALAEAYTSEFIDLLSEIETSPSSDESLVSATLVNVPDLPSSPASPQPRRNFILATLLGLIVGVAVVLVKNVLDTTVKTPEQSVAISHAPSLALLYFIRGLQKDALFVRTNPRSSQAEAFRHLRTNLRFVDIDSPARTIIVTSSVESEGKSTIAANLALALADAGQDVILVDGDLRKPKIADLTGLVGEVGVTNVLLGSLPVTQALQSYGAHTRTPGSLAVLTSGRVPPNPAELLQSQSTIDLLAHLRELADVVVIDAPPLLPVTDAALLTQHADGALVVIRHGKTKRDELTRAVASLERVGGRVLGTVLNGVPAKDSSDYGRYGTYGTYDEIGATGPTLRQAERPNQPERP